MQEKQSGLEEDIKVVKNLGKISMEQREHKGKKSGGKKQNKTKIDKINSYF